MCRYPVVTASTKRNISKSWEVVGLVVDCHLNNYTLQKNSGGQSFLKLRGGPLIKGAKTFNVLCYSVYQFLDLDAIWGEGVKHL